MILFITTGYSQVLSLAILVTCTVYCTCYVSSYYSDGTLLVISFDISPSAYESTALLKTTLQAVIKDRGFQIPWPSAKEVHLAVSHMLEWLGSHPAHIDNACYEHH